MDQAKKAIYGMDISSKHPALNQTVLYFAAARRHKQESLCLARLCIRKGVTLEHADSLNQTPLFYAAREGNAPLVSMLARLGFTLNWRDRNGETALHYAVRYGQVSGDQHIRRSIPIATGFIDAAVSNSVRS